MGAQVGSFAASYWNSVHIFSLLDNSNATSVKDGFTLGTSPQWD